MAAIKYIANVVCNRKNAILTGILFITLCTRYEFFSSNLPIGKCVPHKTDLMKNCKILFVRLLLITYNGLYVFSGLTPSIPVAAYLRRIVYVGD